MDVWCSRFTGQQVEGLLGDPGALGDLPRQRGQDGIDGGADAGLGDDRQVGQDLDGAGKVFLTQFITTSRARAREGADRAGASRARAIFNCLINRSHE
jgi:hypothetical protein